MNQEINGVDEEARLRRWRLVLGKESEDSSGIQLSGSDLRMDRTLESLYESDRTGGLGGSSPNVNRWLGDIRTYFPTQTVRVMQRDALERLDLKRMLLEPELLEATEPDIHLASTLLTLSHVIPERTKATARQVVRKVVEDLEHRLASKLVQAILGSLNHANYTRRPRPADVDWDRTIRANLKTYQPETRTIIAEKLIGNPRSRKHHTILKDIILCVDQSGSMATSVVYSGILAAVMASVRSVRTRLVVFDTSVVDLTDQLQDPVDVLFGTQLGGGTDIDQAVAYCAKQILRPSDTIMVLITDLYEGGNKQDLLQRVEDIVRGGTQLICLLALSDQGAPSYDHDLAAKLAAMDVPTFACTPDLFPDMMATAIRKHDLNAWASRNDIITTRQD